MVELKLEPEHEEEGQPVREGTEVQGVGKVKKVGE